MPTEIREPREIRGATVVQNEDGFLSITVGNLSHPIICPLCHGEGTLSNNKAKRLELAEKAAKERAERTEALYTKFANTMDYVMFALGAIAFPTLMPLLFGGVARFIMWWWELAISDPFSPAANASFMFGMHIAGICVGGICTLIWLFMAAVHDNGPPWWAPEAQRDKRAYKRKLREKK